MPSTEFTHFTRRLLGGGRLARVFVAPGRVSSALYVRRFGQERFVQTLPAADALDEVLLAHASRLDAVEIKLSSELTQLALCPWPKGVWKQAEIRALAQARIKEIYGSEIDWAVAVDQERFQQPLLAVAVDSALLRSLLQTVSVSGVPLHSIKPVFTQVVEHTRRLRSPLHWLGMIEPGRVLVAELREGLISNVRCLHRHDAASADAMLEDLAASMGKSGDDVMRGIDVTTTPGFEYIH